MREHDFGERAAGRQPGEAAQRLRVRFGRAGEAAFISHLDMMRFWERAVRRAGLPLAYSQGFTAHPRISMAAPLPLGVTSDAELMDVYLSRWVAPQRFLQSLRGQLPSCISLQEAVAVPPSLASLQSQVRFAEYRVTLDRSSGPADPQAAIERFLEARSLMWQHARDTGVRSYDLRPLVKDLWLVEEAGDATKSEQAGPSTGQAPLVVIGMVLRCDPSGAGRPEQVAAALGFSQPPLSVHRCRLVIEAPRGPRQ